MKRLLVTSERIVDGTGAPAFAGGVLVEGDRIVAVLRAEASPMRRPADYELVDGGRSVVSPGFVDLHTHSDVSLLSEPGCVSAIVQGITTQVVGHCGFSAAPVSAATRDRMVDEEPVFGFPGVTWSWDGVDGYLRAVEDAAPATNVATLVGHNTVRRLVMGGTGGPADAVQRRAMARHVDEAIDAGAAGFSTGLSYTPGTFADEAELVALTRVAATRQVRHHTHLRYGGEPIRAGLEEAVRIAGRSGAAVNVSHLYPSPADPVDEAERLLADVDTARAAGVDVTFDLTVFPRGGGAWLQNLPAWVREGGLAATIRRIEEPASRATMLTALRQADYDWDDALIVKVNHDRNAHLAGRSIGQIARERGGPPEETALQLVVEDGQFWTAPHVKRQHDLDVLLAHPLCVPITDGMCAHPQRHRHLGVMPKTFGSFPLVLGSYVRERGVLRLEEAVAKLTLLPAQRLGVADRGRLAAGFAADLVVFDPELVGNRATEEDPTAFPAGVGDVLVNGRWALRSGRLTGERAGRVLRRPG